MPHEIKKEGTVGEHISFVIPAYNCADTLEEAVESIFNGNFEKGDEVIIIDDYSTDNTHAVAERIALRHKEVCAFRNEQNKGCPASRNVGISKAKNELIFNLDSDNILAPGNVKKLKDGLLKDKADVAAVQEIRYFLKHKSRVTHKWIFNEGTLSLEDLLAGTINPAASGNYLYTKHSWEKIGRYWEFGKGLNEAWGFSLKQIANGSKFIIVPDTYYFHRVGLDSLTVRELRPENVGSLTKIANRFIQNFTNLLEPADAARIKTDHAWFENLNNHPLHVRGKSIGRNGGVIHTRSLRTIASRLKRRGMRAMLNSLARVKMYITKLSRPTKSERGRADLIKQKFKTLTPPRFENGIALSPWMKNLQDIHTNVLNKDPRFFLDWGTIQYTMVHDCKDEEFFALQKSSHWDKFKVALEESPVGHPRPFRLMKSTSGNLVHQAYSILQLMEKTEFSPSSAHTIVEFGGGYGSMARLMYRLGFTGTYIIFDLPEFNYLQRYYLEGAAPDLKIKEELSSDEMTVVLTSDIQKLADELKKTGTPDLFIALWSLSESPIELRNQIIKTVVTSKHILIAYQALFDGIDNNSYFEGVKTLFSPHKWSSYEIEHLKGEHHYFIGIS